MADRTQKGFSLLELLIVIVVLGVLATVMLLSNIEAMNTANTAAVINNLTSLKKATSTWYLDNYFRVVKDGSKYMVVTDGVQQEVKDFINQHGTEITQYLDNGTTIALKEASSSVPADGYYFKALKNGKEWYMGYKFFNDAHEKDESFMKKFESRASSLNLISITNADKPNAKAEKFGANKDKYVYMLVLELKD